MFATDLYLGRLPGKLTGKPGVSGGATLGTLLGLALAFGLFRAFDGLKPWPIRYVDANVGGGLGVVLDDLLAGLASNLVLRGLFLLAAFVRR